MAKAPAGEGASKLYYLVKQTSCSNTLWLKPPASCRFSAASGQAPAAPGPSSPTMGGGGRRRAPAQSGPPAAACASSVSSKSFSGPFLHLRPLQQGHLNSTWELRLRPIRGRDPTPGVTPRRPVPGVGAPVITATVFDEKPDPHNFWVTKQTRVSAWGLVAARKACSARSASSTS